MGAQYRALRTNVIEVKINKQEDDMRCRMCNDREETVAQNWGTRRHMSELLELSIGVCEKHGLPRAEQW